MPTKKKQVIQGKDFVIIRVVEVEIHRDDDDDGPKFSERQYSDSLKDLMADLGLKDEVKL